VRSATTEATAAVAAVRDDPARRLELAARFYDQRPGITRYRRAEMAFMHWQIERGVLAGPRARRPGSPGWRAVNERLLRDTCEAGALADAGRGARSSSSSSVEHWLRFLDGPSASTWYRAHNASVVAGYLAHRDLAVVELPAERFFMEVALLRVLYAHSLVAAPRLALGRFAPLGRFLGDPRVGMTGAFLSLSRVLPHHYPLDDVALEHMLQDENGLGRILDYAVIGPRLPALYAFAAADIGEPRLLELIADGAPVYTWPSEDAHVWTAGSQPRIARSLSRLTAPPPGSTDSWPQAAPQSSACTSAEARSAELTAPSMYPFQ
jgi:hypothetical protein